jgi:protease IV
VNSQGVDLKCTLPLFLCLTLAGTGCIGPIKTDSRIAVDGFPPVKAQLSVDVPAKNTGPLVAMPVESGDAAAIAVVDVDGLLVNQNITGPYASGENPVDLFRERLDAVAANNRVCAVVLRINSPGGSVTATDIMWRELLNFKAKTNKKVVVCLMDYGCSGGYYLATAGDFIVAHPTTLTGGIGVVFNSYNTRDSMGLVGMIPQIIKSGENIDMGAVTDSLPKEVRKMLQSVGDDLHRRFRKIVVDYRPGVVQDETTFDGRIFTSQQALERKLIDHIGYLPEAIATAKQLARQPAAQVIFYHRENDPARTPYATSPNQPLQHSLLPLNLPGLDRSRLPAFLYLWQPDPTLIRLGGM